MLFEHAEKEIATLAGGKSYALSYHKNVFNGTSTINCHASIGGNSYWAATWDGVINALKIAALPIGTPTPEEAPNE